jgi:hypothetical protein
MKIRISGNSIRIRLSKPEVEKLRTKGSLEDKTSFGTTTYFSYAVERKDGIKTLSANYHQNKITLMVPETLVKDWPENTVVGFDSHQTINETETLYLLLEKDFKCLDPTLEDQSNNFENPNKIC